MKQASPTPILKASSQKPDLPVGKQVRDAVQKGIGGQQAMKSPSETAGCRLAWLDCWY
jgi:hypothetical protein